MSDGGAIEGLPPGWAWATLESINDYAATTVDPAKCPNEEFELYSVPSFPSGYPEYLLGSSIGSSKQIVAESDILLCKINPRINRVWIVDAARNERRQIASSEWIVVRSRAADPSFLRHYFSSHAFREVLCSDVSGVGGSLTRARPNAVRQYPVSLPPIAEQRRIALKIEELLSRSRAAREALDAVPAMLEQYRKSVLAAAFRGELTEEWQNRSNSNDTSESAGTQDHLPSSWQHTSIGELSAEVPNALTIGPFGSDLKTKDYQDSGVPLVFVRDIRARSFGTLTPKFISTDKARQLARHTVRPGDLLVTKMGDPPGDTAIYPPTRPPGIITADCIKLTPSDRTTSEFLLHWLRAPAICALLSEETQGVAQQKLSLERFRSVAIPLPPRDEQDEIVRRVEAALARIERVKSAVAAQRAQLDALDRAILDKAFRGELVPQDPNDEPAAVMLERLRAEREATAPKKKGARKGGKAG